MQERSILSHLTVSSRLKEILGTIVTWAKIIAIINFIAIPLKFYNDIKSNEVFSAIIVATVTLIMNIYLINFSIKVKRGIATSEQYDFSSGMKDLRDYFKVVGIFIIILMIMMVVALLYTVTTASRF
jgi:hypothetical protein